MSKSNKFTVTDARLLEALGKAYEMNEGTYTGTTGGKMTTSSKSGNAKREKKEKLTQALSFDVQTGKMLKYYFTDDKAEVKLNNGRIVLARLTRPVPDGLSFFYTPDAEYKWDKDRKKTYYKPLAAQGCIVFKINNEWFLDSYYTLNTTDYPVMNYPNTIVIGTYDSRITIGGPSGSLYFESPNLVFKDRFDYTLQKNIALQDVADSGGEDVNERIERLEQKIGEVADKLEALIDDLTPRLYG